MWLPGVRESMEQTKKAMNQEDIQQALEVLRKSGITVNGDLVLEKHVEHEVGNVEAGGIGIQINQGGEEKPLVKSDEDMKQTLSLLMDAKDEKGKYIFNEQDQWYAVYKVLTCCCGYPQKMSEFERVIKNLGADTLRVACKYDSFRKVTLNELPQNPRLWQQYENTANQYSMKFIKVALKLMELLQIEDK